MDSERSGKDPRMNSRKKGSSYEEIAIQFLTERGIHIIKKNYRIRQGEVDLIGEDASHLIFFEVKFRKNDKYGEPYEAVSVEKQRKICKVAEYYLVRFRTKKQIRYDVISILDEKIYWYQDAFYHQGYF